MNNSSLILPSSYFGSIFQYALLAKAKEYRVDGFEHFIKQSYRSRCEIYGANGKMSLIVPLKKWKNHCLTKDILVSYDDNWQILHWRSIESAYRTSPYFEFYEEEVKPLFFLKEERLIEYNRVIEKELCQLIQLPVDFIQTAEYIESSPDWRQIINPKNKELKEKNLFQSYIQVFESKFEFIPNLSILDLLFNLGPNSKNYLENLSLETWQKR